MVPMQRVLVVLCHRIKQLGHEAVPLLNPCVFMACNVIKHRDNFTFLFQVNQQNDSRKAKGRQGMKKNCEFVN
jgi:hypothetical protein